VVICDTDTPSRLTKSWLQPLNFLNDKTHGTLVTVFIILRDVTETYFIANDMTSY
jgi:hypothetical protein